MKKLIALLLMLTLALSACGGDKSKDEAGKEDEEKVAIHKKPIDNQFKGKTLKVVSFTKDLQYAAKAFEEAYACKVEVSYKEAADMAMEMTKIETGEATDDIYTIDAAMMKDWLAKDVLSPLTDVSAESYAPYATAFATSADGQLRALTWSATPVNLYYRRSIAKATLLDDSPEAVAASVTDLVALNELANKLHAGGYKLFSNLEDMRPFYQPKDKVEYAVISPEENQFLTAVKQMNSEYRIAGLQKWSNAWFKGMYGKASNPVTGKELEIFGYVMPSWAKSYILEKAGDSSEPTENPQNPTWGDWAMTTLPQANFSDGIWLGIGKNSSQADFAKAFLVYVTQNQLFLEKWLEKTQELPAFIPVLESFQPEREDSFLGGQKVMPYYVDTIRKIPAKSAEALDKENQYYAVLTEFLEGKIATIEELQTKLATPQGTEAPAQPEAPAAAQ